MTNWFKREKENIKTLTDQKRETPDGLWTKCPSCKKSLHIRQLQDNSYVCPFCDYHHNIGSEEYFQLLLDNNEFTEIAADLTAVDILKFVDTKPYSERIIATQKKTNLKDAIRVALGKMNGLEVIIACMDFDFIGGSMGSVVGEKIARAVDYAIENHLPLIIISKSGGARMMESAMSLMQMAKTSAKLAILAQHKLPYISLCTNPTTGGVTASFAMLGDINLAEPKALIGFAGPRVIEQTIGKSLPEGFQTAEFLLEHGFLDAIAHRKELKETLTKITRHLLPE